MTYSWNPLRLALALILSIASAQALEGQEIVRGAHLQDHWRSSHSRRRLLET